MTGKDGLPATEPEDMQGKRMETGVCAVEIVCILNIFPCSPVGGYNLQRFPCVFNHRAPPFLTSRMQSEKHCLGTGYWGHEAGDRTGAS